jgi:hypothetical protein
MTITKTAIHPFSAQITIGLERGYTQALIPKETIIKFLQDYQYKLFKEKKVALSVSVSACDIVFSGQVEPHLKLYFINYPKFPLKETLLKKEIEKMTLALMEEFDQNRVVIEYLDETVMLEGSDRIDPRIKQQHPIKST